MNTAGPGGSGPRFKIICSNPTPETLPLSLGVCLAYARETLPAELFDFGPHFVSDPAGLDQALTGDARPVLLCSNYFWNIERNLELSRQAKAIRSDCLTVHGGPSTPFYPEACEDFLRRRPEVDYAVLGEGEAPLAALLALLTQGRPPEGPEPGIAFIRNDRFIRSLETCPLKDLNQIPSPYLTGLFDGFDPEITNMAVIETNRGCPYGCAYCSWSDPLSARNQHKIRKFDLDRVRAEIEWVGAAGLEKLYIADSNFGLFPRDVTIARYMAETFSRHGRPASIYFSNAKNNLEYTMELVDILESNGLNSNGGVIGVQTRDPEALKAVNRRNMDLAEFDRLKNFFESRGFPIVIHLMLGLPGATAAGFVEDLRYYFDQPLETNIFPTFLLPNSPMADPAFPARRQIEVDRRNIVIATAEMPRDRRRESALLACFFDAVHNLGLLRFPLLWLWWEKGMDPVGILAELARDPDGPARFPELFDALAEDYTILDHHFFRSKKNRREYDWDSFHAEFALWLEERRGPVDEGPLNSLFQVQKKMMTPRPDEYPIRVELEFDVPRWYLDRKNGRAVRLQDFPPGGLMIESPCFFWKKWIKSHVIKPLSRENRDRAP